MRLNMFGCARCRDYPNSPESVWTTKEALLEHVQFVHAGELSQAGYMTGDGRKKVVMPRNISFDIEKEIVCNEFA